MTSRIQSPNVIMLGPHPKLHGGMSSVLQGYITAGFFQSGRIRLLPTLQRSSQLGKLVDFLQAYISFIYLALLGRYQILHVHSACYGSFWRKTVFLLTARCFGLRSIFHLHGGEFEIFYAKQPKFLQQFIRYVLNHVDCLLVLSNTWKRILARHINSNQHIEVIPNGVEYHNITLTQDASSINLIYMGRLHADKGIFELFTAFSRILSIHPNAQLICAGLGEQPLAYWQTQAERFGIKQQTKFPGWVTGTAKATLLSSATCVILPSHAECMPVILLEAMSYQKPVIATPVGGVPDMIEHEKEGLLVPAGNVDALTDAIHRLIEQPELRHQLGQEGHRKILREYSIERVLLSLTKLYQAMVNNHGD